MATVFSGDPAIMALMGDRYGGGRESVDGQVDWTNRNDKVRQDIASSMAIAFHQREHNGALSAGAKRVVVHPAFYAIRIN